MAVEPKQPGQPGYTGASSGTDQAAETARNIGESAKQTAQAGKEQASQTARDLGSQAQERAESGKEQAAERLDHVSEAVRHAAHGMEDQEAWLAGLVERGADEMSRLAETLRTNDLRSLLHHAEDLARRQPMLAAGAAFAAGFAAVRAARVGMAEATNGHGTPTARRGDGAMASHDTMGNGPAGMRSTGMPGAGAGRTGLER